MHQSTKTAPNHAWTAQLCQSAHPDKLPVLQGDTIPNFPLPMASGDTVMLYDLLGEKLTLLDIWASWCAPCRKENREVLAPLWSERGNTGLQIVGYAIDSSPQAWKAAIAKDGATWPQASHLSGDDTPFLQMLNITTIPANFILDKNGVVLAKNLHGEALKAFLEGR
jgi:peroxiredoxin